MSSPPVKVLVAAASRHGATQELAEAIGRTLGEEGLDPSVSAIGEAGDPAGYDAVIIGSAVYMGRWLDPATTFIASHGAELADRPTWLFSSGPIGDPPRPGEAQAVDVAEVMAKTQAKGHKLFAGKLDKDKLGFGERAVMLAFRAAECDYRNWDAVEAWARGIAGELRR
jgi:menaquinone-dependent protoporphyrinogen oxidase